jgi:predicted SAM-dependent methyltransferase
MNRTVRAKAGHDERADARGTDSRSRVVSALSDRLEGGVFARVAGDAPFHELARHAEASVDLLYCGGILHRLSRAEGADVVAACFRVLKPLGSIRVATIDLDRIVQGYLFDWTDDDDPGASRAERLNAAFRQPGIQFIYDEEDLTALLGQAGFADIRRFGVGASANRRFWNLESDHADALVLEATKP